jgi:hypothetical protein
MLYWIIDLIRDRGYISTGVCGHFLFYLTTLI